MCHNQTNDLGVMVSESCWWLLKILIGPNKITFWLWDLGLMKAKFCGNSKPQSRREFHKLSKEGGNSEFRYRVKEPWRVEVERILEIRLHIGIFFLSFFWFSRFASWCNMNVWCHATCWPYTFLSKRKRVPNIYGACIVDGKDALIPVVSSNEIILHNHC
jgi:hypothetical protein